jgi:pimeloyl-ACP methyl ester carboxylesterase
METVRVDDVDCRLQRQGDGSPVLYLHSCFGEVGELPFFAALDNRGFSVVAPELPGFGATSAPRDWNRVEDAAFHLRRLCDVLGLERVAVVGSSFGGWLAAELAVWYPERFTALVLVSPFGLRVEGSPLPELFWSRQEDQDEVVARAFPGGGLAEALAPVLENGRDEAALAVHLLQAMEGTARLGWSPYLHDPRLERRLAALSVPALVVWGTADRMLPGEHADRYAEAIPHARLRVCEAWGHVPALEHPDKLAALVASFIFDQEGHA